MKSTIFQVIGLASLSFLLRFWAFSQTRYANGWDAYFYLVQVKSWVTEGNMHTPDAALIYPLMRLILGLAGGDYVLMYQITAAFLAGLFTVAVGSFGNYSGSFDAKNANDGVTQSQNAIDGVTLSHPVITVLLAWSVFSPHLTYFAAQYPKNLLGLVLLVFFMGALNTQNDGATKHDGVTQSHPVIKRYRTIRWLLPFVLLMINYFGHRFTFVLAVLYGVIWWFYHHRKRLWKSLGTFGKWRAAKFLPGWAVSVLAVAILFSVAFLFPGLFHWADFGRLSDAFSAVPQFAPWSFIQEFDVSRISIWWLAEIVCVTLLFFRGWISIILHRPATNGSFVIPLFVLLTLLLFPFLEWSFTGIAYRSFLVWVLLCPLAGFYATPKFRPFLSLCLLVAAFFSWKSYSAALHDPDYARFERITTSVGHYFRQHPASAANPLPELLICHNSLAEFYTFTTGADALPWQPEYSLEPAQLWRLAAGIHPKTLQYYAGQEQAITTVSHQYSLLPEWLWQQALKKAEMEEDTAFLRVARSWHNPHRMRPGWLLRK